MIAERNVAAIGDTDAQELLRSERAPLRFAVVESASGAEAEARNGIWLGRRRAGIPRAGE